MSHASHRPVNHRATPARRSGSSADGRSGSRLVGRIDLRAGEVPDVGDRLKEIARELVDFLQVTAIEEERGPVERRKRSHPLVFEVQRHRNRPALRRMPLQHAPDFGEPAVELTGEFCKLRNQPLAVDLPHVCRTLPHAF